MKLHLLYNIIQTFDIDKLKIIDFGYCELILIGNYSRCVHNCILMVILQFAVTKDNKDRNIMDDALTLFVEEMRSRQT